MERLKDLRPVLFTGEQSSAQKAESIRVFREGPAQVLIMSLPCNGAGIDGAWRASAERSSMESSIGHRPCMSREPVASTGMGSRTRWWPTS